MTREEFNLKLVQPNSGSEAFNKGIKQANSRAKRLFKKALDDFESRVCENCKYFNVISTYGTIDCELLGYVECHKGFDYDFGCNKFEHK